MKKSVKKALKFIGWALLLLLLVFAIQVWRNWDTIQRTMLGGLKVYETEAPAMPPGIQRPAILVFSKTNGFRHEEAIPVANALFETFAKDNGWGYFQTENGAAFSPEILSRFDAVIFNNVSGDVFTADQRAAFQQFLVSGGGYVGIHAAGDNSHEAWPWYVDQVIGTHWIGHPIDPQFQKATVHIEDRIHAASAQLPDRLVRTDEWYSFDKSPRKEGISVLATLDESTYDPGSMFGTDLAMGKDHPIVWSRCVGEGRALYSAMGHQPTAFAEPEYRQMLLGATNWVLRKAGEGCNGSATNIEDEVSAQPAQ
ncbi:MAG: ThuA domain-containing protein [Novosphingobium sp.]|nr:ThuA domain-containing protein [Novosphingobium sp.]